MNQKENFIQAIREDEYAEWKLSENVTLETDHQFDGTFLPWLCVTDESLSEQELDDLMTENDVDDVFYWDGLEASRQEHLWDIYGVECEYENVDCP